jgi:SnoaL-like domain
MIDNADAGDTITRMLHAIDAKDWQGVRDEFADTLDMDYQSLFGDPPIRIDADQQVNGWRQFAGAFDVTQHLTGPIVVVSDRSGAVADTHVRAYHRIAGAAGGDVWMVAGHYNVKLILVGDHWKIAGMTLTVFYQEGNLRIPEIARARAGAS